MAGDTLDRIRSLRATSELENRRRSFAETTVSTSANEELSSFPVPFSTSYMQEFSRARLFFYLWAES